MHDETDPRVTGFVEELRAAYGSAPAPAPSPSLATLFAEGMAVSPEARRRQVKQGLKAVPGKVAAGLVGLLIGYTGLGAAGAVPGPLALVSDDTEQVELVEEEVEQEETEDLEEVEEVVEETEQETTTEAPVDLADVPVPTSVSEAAHNHAFDEACGNHGAYVSHFARFGTEPECATAARAGTGEEPAVEAATDDGEADEKKAKKAKPAKAKKAKKAKRAH